MKQGQLHAGDIVVAHAVRPLLNRLVFTGIHVSRILHTGDRSRIRRPTLVSPMVSAVATVAIDRLAPELSLLDSNASTAEGIVSCGKYPAGFVSSCHMQVEMERHNDDIVRDYAVLLTRSVSLSADLTARVTVPAIQFALSWAA